MFVLLVLTRERAMTDFTRAMESAEEGTVGLIADNDELCEKLEIIRNVHDVLVNEY